MYVEYLGERGQRLLLVHGGIVPGWQTWEAQRPLAESYRLVVPHGLGYPPNAPGEGVDFESQSHAIAEMIEPGTHVRADGGRLAVLAAALADGQMLPHLGATFPLADAATALQGAVSGRAAGATVLMLEGISGDAADHK